MRRLNVVAILIVLVIAGAVIYFPLRGFITWSDMAKFAPIATATVAVCAGLIALYSISVQRDMAMKRAAVDIFVRTETDEKMIDAYDRFRLALEALQAAPTTETFCTSEACRPQYLAIRKYLNVLEFIAVGIKNHIFDEKTCFDFFGDIMIHRYADSRPVVDFVRARPRNRYTYCELDRLNARWRRRQAT